MADRQIHVRILERQWGVCHPGRDVPESSHRRKSDAVAAARRLAAEHDAEIVVFGLDGSPQLRVLSSFLVRLRVPAAVARRSFGLGDSP